jgi:phosphonate transport system substrate-binding protein
MIILRLKNANSCFIFVRRREVKKNFLFVLVSVLVLGSLLLGACAQATPVPTAEPTVAPTEAPVTLGTADNPIIMAMAPSATSEQLTTGGEAIAAKLKELTGYEFKLIIPTNYTALIEAMASGNAQVGWMPPLAYLLAKQKDAANVALVVTRSGSEFYSTEFLADKDSGFTSYFDAATGKSTADAKTALAQFEGLKPCYTDPLSASGYVIPSGILKDAGVKTKAGAWVQGHPMVVTAVSYGSVKNGGICDFGTTYNDAWSGSTIPDAVKAEIVVIWRSDNLIPNDNVAYSPSLPADMAAKITEALTTMASTEDGIAILKSAGYSVQGLVPHDDTFYDPFRVYLQASGIDITTLVK